MARHGLSAPTGPEHGLWCAPLARCLVDHGPDGGHYSPLTVDEYCTLVDETGRIIKRGKRGAIPAHLAPILERLELDCERWLDAMRTAGSLLGRAIGTARSRAAAAARAGKQWLCDKARIFKPPAQAPSG